jgi:hypothetical protein
MNDGRENGLVSSLSLFLDQVQRSLFPKLEEAFGPLSEKDRRVVKTLELVRIEAFVHHAGGRWPGRPAKDRRFVARAFVAKSVLELPTTRALLDRLQASVGLRRICGWERWGDVPSEATFSRAFEAFSSSELPQRVHAALIETHERPRLVGHISRDATAVKAREKANRRPRHGGPPVKKLGRRGRLRKGERRPPQPPTRLQRQASGMTLDAMLAELPRRCDWGCKRNSAGTTEHWKGYKLHVDWADGEIPISCALTSASVHDSQVAIPLATMTSQRVTNLYDLMDAAYDAKEIHEYGRGLGHIPIIESNSRSRNKPRRELDPASARRYDERTTAERGNSRLHDQFGGRTVRVRGPLKVMAHLMFGIVALTADQLLRLSG